MIMSDGLKCSLCKQTYKLPDCMRDSSFNQDCPMLLRCGHTFCHKCLIYIQGSGQVILCPSCKTCTKCPQEKGRLQGLMPNTCVLGQLALRDTTFHTLSKLTSMTEVLRQKTVLKNDPTKQKCSECVNQKATTTCVQCGVSMCCECFDTVHGNSRVLRRHQGIPLSHGSQDLSSLDCCIHHSMTEFYCADDEKLVCRDCIYTDHSTHKVISLQERSKQMSSEVKQALKEANPVLSSLKIHMHDIEEEIKKVEAEAKLKSNKILDYFLEISGKVQSNFLSAMNNLERSSCAIVEHLLVLRDDTIRRIKSVEAYCADANLIINSSNESERYVVNPLKTLAQLKLVNNHPCVLNRILDVEDEDDRSEEKKTERFQLNVNREVLNNAIFWVSVNCCDNSKYIAHKAENNDHDIDEDIIRNEEFEDVDVESSVSSAELESGGGEKLRLLCVPPACNQEHVFVTRVITPHNFYIQRNCDQEQIKQILKSLQVFSHQPVRPDEIVTCIRIGELCVACSPSRQWCRVKVNKILKRPERYSNDYDSLDEFHACSKDDVEVMYIDYGRVSKTKVSCLRILPHKFQRIPPLAFSCSLVGVTPYSIGTSWNQEAISVFSKMVANRPVLMTTVSREAGQRYVDLHKPAPDEIDNGVPVSVRDALIFLKLARFGGNELLKYDEPIKHREYFKPTTLPSRSFVSVVLSHFQSISRFFVQQLDSNASYLEDLTHKIQQFVNVKRKGGFDASSPFSVLCPYIGMPCLAMYECCNMWYRAKITDVFEEKREMNVVYVDYGNEARIGIHDALKIPDIYMKLPYQGITCQLTDIQPPNGHTEWANESLDRFFELVGEDRQMKMYIKSMANGVYNVELFDELDDERSADNTLSVNERLVHEGLAAGLTVHNVVTTSDLDRNFLSLCSDPQPGLVKLAKPFPRKMKAPSGLFVGNAKLVDSFCNGMARDVTAVQCESPASFHVQAKDQWVMSNSLTRDLHKQITEQEEKICNKRWSSGCFCVFHSSQEKRWCRGKIKEIHELKPDQNENVRTCGVYVIDFGFTEKTLIASLRELPEKFVTDQPCVTRCFLVDVQPAGGPRWTNNAIEAFKKFVLNKRCKLVATGRQNEHHESLPVKLYLPGDEEDVGRKLVLKGVALPVLKSGSSRSKSSSSDASTPLNKIRLHFELSEAAYQRAENLCSVSSDSSSLSRCDVKVAEDKEKLEGCTTEPTTHDPNVSLQSICKTSNLPPATECDDLSAFPENIAIAQFPQNANTHFLQHSSEFVNVANERNAVESVDAAKPLTHDIANNDDHDVVKTDNGKRGSSFFENEDVDGRFEDSPIDDSIPPIPQKSFKVDTEEVDDYSFSNCLSAPTGSTSQKSWCTEIPPAESLARGAKFDCVVSHIDQYNVLYLKKLPVEDIFLNGKEFAATAPLLDDFAIGSPCLACFDEDNDWHRAEIAGCESKVTYVRYVDYGLVQPITELNRLLVLPTEYARPRAQAVACCLASMPTPKQIGMDESDMMAMLANLIGRNTFECSVVDEKSSLTGFPLVKLYSKNNSALVADQFHQVLADAHSPQSK